MQLTAAGIVGIGAVSGYGWGMKELWSGLATGESSARLHHGLGGRFPDPCWFARVPEGGDPEVGHTRYVRAAFAAADEAVTDALARGWTPGERVAIVHATTRADLELVRNRYLDPGWISPRSSYVEQTWTTPPALVMIKYGFTGPSVVTSAACSSGLHALTLAQRLLTCGDATDVIVTGADVGFDGEEMRLGASVGPLIHDRPPHEVCRPFQKGTRGFVLGEGAAALVLTPARQAQPYLELLSSCLANDAFHPVAIEPSFRHILTTVDDALGRAGVRAADIGYYNAHGTGTRECYDADLAALGRLGPRATAYGFKPMFGHSMGAAPLLDTVTTARAHEEGVLPAPVPAAGDAHSQLAPGAVAHTGGLTLQVGLGFGGNICAAVFRAPTGEGSSR
ncbi:MULTISPECIES: beta-ketoacyl synthase N-terminal-like domain-containing protein [unclassified Streptomyces]|uniref:beta-ketoacyl synthase N-terminal-like domain-containing protein n=1 Tax=unclassified Streptomyces TaxID=2593676 RepID=UPI001369046B|nr:MULTISPECIES: beta-ketoacyl synthase N-terminal-like domain-containing protein [unclassified Streptomyces]MCW5251287.1 3-oxoacyl-ACP synthase [Streptomyces sp. SHP 1-2]MYU22659.1 3-oxoacyl-ACP synthase [Streptomyces sp. SID8352]